MTEWFDIGHIDDIPSLGARVVQTPQGDIAVFRTADDRIFALHDKCPHKGGPLSQGIVHGNRVTCPLHNWVIQLDTGEAAEPDEGSTACFPVRVDQGRVSLRIPQAETKRYA
ncbi:MAG: nitrite reductase small subunit NirD [Rhodospirillales bacterium]|nr:nitrite reductase small subunit NirD [Rhodospirillales bacterium]